MAEQMSKSGSVERQEKIVELLLDDYKRLDAANDALDAKSWQLLAVTGVVLSLAVGELTEFLQTSTGSVIENGAKVVILFAGMTFFSVIISCLMALAPQPWPGLFEGNEEDIKKDFVNANEDDYYRRIRNLLAGEKDSSPKDSPALIPTLARVNKFKSGWLVFGLQSFGAMIIFIVMYLLIIAI